IIYTCSLDVDIIFIFIFFSFFIFFFFFSSRRRHTRWPRDWSSDVCSSDLLFFFHVPTSEMIWPKKKSWKFRCRSARTVERKRERSEERRVGKECRSRRWTDE